MEIYLGLITEKLPAYRQRNKIGDCLAYRQQKWGMYDDIAEETGMAKQTLKDTKWVSENVESSLRKDNLSFNHHKEVASLPSGSTRSTRMEQTGVINIQKVPQIKMIRSKMPVTKKESHLLQWLSKTDLK